MRRLSGNEWFVVIAIVIVVGTIAGKILIAYAIFHSDLPLWLKISLMH